MISHYVICSLEPKLTTNKKIKKFIKYYSESNLSNLKYEYKMYL